MFVICTGLWGVSIDDLAQISFKREDPEAQRGGVTRPRPHSKVVAVLELEPRVHDV